MGAEKTRELEERIARLEDEVARLKKPVSTKRIYDLAMEEIIKSILDPITKDHFDGFIRTKITGLAREIFVTFLYSGKCPLDHTHLHTVFGIEGWGESFELFKSIVTSITENVLKIVQENRG